MKVAAANVTGRDEGCEGGDGGSEGRGGLGEVKAGAELAAVAELVMATPRLVESWAVLPSSASQGRLGGIERWHDYGDLKDGTARGDLDGDGAHVHAQQTGKSNRNCSAMVEVKSEGLPAIAKVAETTTTSVPPGWAGGGGLRIHRHPFTF